MLGQWNGCEANILVFDGLPFVQFEANLFPCLTWISAVDVWGWLQQLTCQIYVWIIYLDVNQSLSIWLYGLQLRGKKFNAI